MSTIALIVPKWLGVAFNELGIEEISGPGDNPRIQEYLAVVGMPGAQDDTAWCAAFVSWVLREVELHYSQSGMARSWLHHGTRVPAPRYGDIVVLWRGSLDSLWGHVGFYVGFNKAKDQVYMLGGNQDNRVSIRAYSLDRLLDYIRPRTDLIITNGGNGI